MRLGGKLVEPAFELSLVSWVYIILSFIVILMLVSLGVT